MKANRKYVEGEEAVSAVIGVILMVAITVAIAATVYVYVSGMIGGTTTSTSTIAMNKYSSDASAYKIVWMVSQIEGEPVKDDQYEWALLDDDGTNATGATCTFVDNNNDNYLNSGDTFQVNTTGSGNYVLTITDATTGGLLFKSAATKY